MFLSGAGAPAAVDLLLPQVTTRLRELHTTIEAGERHRTAVLQQIAFNLEEWTTKVRAR